MSDKSSSVRQYSTIGCLVFLIGMAVVFIVWMSWRILHAPVPPKPVDDSLHRVDSIRKNDSVRKADSLRDVDSLVGYNIKSFFYPSCADFQDSLFQFHLTYDSIKNYDGSMWEHSLRKIEIYHLQEPKPFQTVLTHSDQEIDRYGRCPILMKDMNFDGYTDIGYVVGAYVNGCAQYGMWLYDPAKKKFVENTELEATFDPEFDPKEKLVYSWKNETYSPVDETRECFSWKNGKLFLEHKEECFSDPAGSISTLTMTKRINGKLVSRSKDYKDAPIDSLGTVKYNWDEMK